MNNPKLSIITVNLNNASGLRKTIESVVNQTYQDFEYIIIDGGSTDGSVDVIREYEDKITYWVSEPDKGIYNAMNKGIEASKGEYINFINSGDILSSNYVTCIIVNVLKENQVDDNSILIMDCLTVDKDEYCIVRANEIKLKSDLISSFLPHPSTFYNKNSFKIIGGFNEKNLIISDWEWYMEAIFKYQFKIFYYSYCNSIFFKDGISSNNSLTHREEFNKVLNKYYTQKFVKIISSKKYKSLKRLYIIRYLLNTLGYDRYINITDISKYNVDL